MLDGGGASTAFNFNLLSLQRLKIRVNNFTVSRPKGTIRETDRNHQRMTVPIRNNISKTVLLLSRAEHLFNTGS